MPKTVAVIGSERLRNKKDDSIAALLEHGHEIRDIDRLLGQWFRKSLKTTTASDLLVDELKKCDCVYLVTDGSIESGDLGLIVIAVEQFDKPLFSTRAIGKIPHQVKQPHEV